MNTRTKLLFTTLLVVAVALVAFHSSGVLAQAADNGLNVMSNARAPAVMQVALNGNSLFHSTRVSTLRTDHERVLGMATTSADDCNLLGLAAVVADRTDDVDGMGVVTYIQNESQEWFSPVAIEIWFKAQADSPTGAYLRGQQLTVSGPSSASGLSTFHQGMSLALLEFRPASLVAETVSSSSQKLNEKQVEYISFDARGYLNPSVADGALVGNVNMAYTSRTVAWSAPASRSGGGAEMQGLLPGNSANDSILVSVATSGFLPDTYTVASSSRTDTPNARKSQVRQTLLLSTSTSQALANSFAFSSYQLLA